MLQTAIPHWWGVAHVRYFPPDGPRALVIAMMALALGSCSSSTEATSLDRIDSTSWARFVAKDLAAAGLFVRSALNNGTYSGTPVSGNSGTAMVSGTVSFQSNISCGSNCVRSENNTSLTMVFNNFVVNTADNTTTTLSGTMTYTDSQFSQQSGLSFTSGGSLCVSSSGNLSYRLVGTDAAGQFGVNDTITSLSSCGSNQTQSGSLTTSSGTFSF